MFGNVKILKLNQSNSVRYIYYMYINIRNCFELKCFNFDWFFYIFRIYIIYYKSNEMYFLHKTFDWRIYSEYWEYIRVYQTNVSNFRHFSFDSNVLLNPSNNFSTNWNISLYIEQLINENTFRILRRKECFEFLTIHICISWN